MALLGYKLAFWVFYLVAMTLSVLDRFFTNLMQRRWFNQPGVGDSMTIKDGPWTVQFNDFFSKFSGRYTLVALCFLLFTMMHTTHFYLSTTWLGRLINFNDHNGRTACHRWVGISQCAVTILHVWTVTFPGIFSGYTVIVNAGYFVWPLSEATPVGFKQANTTSEVMMMQVDDVYRLILMSIMMGPFIFLSVRWMATNYRFGIRLHQFMLVMYTIDIVRRHSHPRCWVFNIPFFLAWLVDLAVGHYYKHQRTFVDRVNLGENYMLVAWKSITESKFDTIADYFHLRVRCSCCTGERSHPFTTFKKRCNAMTDIFQVTHPSNNKVLVKSSEAEPKIAGQNQPKFKGQDWDRVILLRTYTRNKLAHTKLMREAPELEMDFWGNFAIDDIKRHVDCKDDLILVGGGSGAAFLLDTLSYLASKQASQPNLVSLKRKAWTTKGPQPGNPALYRTSVWVNGFSVDSTSSNQCQENFGYIPDFDEKQSTVDLSTTPNPGKAPKKRCKALGIIYTSNDLNLVHWFVNVVDDLLASNPMPPALTLSITIAFTGNNDVTIDASHVTWGRVLKGRADFVKEIDRVTQDSKRKCHVFCQGGLRLQGAVREAARETGKIFHDAHSFDSGPATLRVSCTCSGGMAWWLFCSDVPFETHIQVFFGDFQRLDGLPKETRGFKSQHVSSWCKRGSLRFSSSLRFNLSLWFGVACRYTSRGGKNEYKTSSLAEMISKEKLWHFIRTRTRSLSVNRGSVLGQSKPIVWAMFSSFVGLFCPLLSTPKETEVTQSTVSNGQMSFVRGSNKSLFCPRTRWIVRALQGRESFWDGGKLLSYWRRSETGTCNVCENLSATFQLSLVNDILRIIYYFALIQWKYSTG